MLSHKKEYELPINKEYVLHWGTAEAIREIIQNAIDSEAAFEWEFEDGSLSVSSKGVTLKPSTLLLGTTTKKDREDSIGSFGEGYKIAMLVLARLGYDVTIYNGGYIWKPKFKFNKLFESEMLYVVETICPFKNTGLKFKIDGLSNNDINLIKKWCLFMKKDIGEIKTVRQGRILIDMPRKLFVGGLYICDTELDYGYDLNPNEIKLERDRQTVSTFDLQFLTKEMWFDTKNYDQISKLIEKDSPDLKYAEYNTPELVKEACYNLFVTKHPNCVVANSQEELNTMVQKGMANTVYIGGGGYRTIVTGSRNYKTTNEKHIADVSINKTLEQWFDTNKQRMRRKAIVSFKKLLKDSESWGTKMVKLTDYNQ